MKDRDEFENFIQQQVEGFEEKPIRSVWKDIENEIPQNNKGFNSSLLFIGLMFTTILLLWSVNIFKGKNILGSETGKWDVQDVNSNTNQFILFPSFNRAKTAARIQKRSIFSFWVNSEEEQKRVIYELQQYFKNEFYNQNIAPREVIWVVDINNNKKKRSFTNLSITEFNGTPVLEDYEYEISELKHNEFNRILEMYQQIKKLKISKGEKLFADNCSSCHEDDMVSSIKAPALGGIKEKRQKDWLYSFTRNSLELINQGDQIATQLNDDWKETDMTSFPDLTDEELDDLYYYVDDAFYNISPSNRKSNSSNQHSVQGVPEKISGDHLFQIQETGPIDSLLLNGDHFRDTIPLEELRQN